MARINLAVACLATLFASGCASGPALSQGKPASGFDQLVGCYAQSERGSASLRLEPREDKFILSGLGAEPPIAPLELTPYPEERLEMLSPGLRDKVDLMLTLGSSPLGIVKLKKGAELDGVKAESEYVLLAPQVGGPLFPRECPR